MLRALAKAVYKRRDLRNCREGGQGAQIDGLQPTREP